MTANSIITLFSILALSTSGFAQSIQWVKEAHPDGLQTNGVQFTADGKRILTVTNCHPAKIRLFSADEGELEWDYEVSSNLLCIMGGGIASNGKYIAAIEEFGNLLVFDYTQNPPDSINTIDIGTPYAFSMDFSPSGTHVVVGASNGKMVVCSVDSAKVLLSKNAHLDWVTTVQYAPNGKYIASGGNGGAVKLWDTLGNLYANLAGHQNYVTQVEFNQDGTKLISSSRDQTVKIWDVQSKELIRTIDVSRAQVNGVSISPDQQSLAVISSDSTLRLYSTATWELQSFVRDELNGLGLCVDWSPEGEQIVVGTYTGMVVNYRINQLSIPLKEERNGLISVYPNPTAGPLHLNTGQGVIKYRLHSSDGKVLLTGSANPGINTIELEELSPGQYFLRLTDPQNNLVDRVSVIKY